MVKYFLIYAADDEETAKRVHATLRKSGMTGACGTEADAQALADASVLLILLSRAEVLDEVPVRRAWEWFDNEIRWKRKRDGEILFLAADDQAAAKRPVRLRKYGYFLLDETEDAARYCLDAAAQADDRKAKEAEAVPPVKQIVYSPPEETVKQIEFSVRAPSVPSFDGDKKRDPVPHDERHEGICREDHIFGENEGIPEKHPEKKANLFGCLIAFVALVFALGIIIPLIVAFSHAASGGRILSQTWQACRGVAQFALQAVRARGIL